VDLLYVLGRDEKFLTYLQLSVFRAGNQSLSFSSSRSQDDKATLSSSVRVSGRRESLTDVDGVSEHVGKFTIWFNDFTRFDQQLHLLIDLHVFTEADEQLLVLLKVSCVPVLSPIGPLRCEGVVTSCFLASTYDDNGQIFPLPPYFQPSRNLSSDKML